MTNWKDSVQKRRVVPSRLSDTLIGMCEQWLGMLDKDMEDSVKVDRMKKKLKHLQVWVEANVDSENIKW